MTTDQNYLRRADRLIWSVIFIVALIDLAAAAAGYFAILWASFLNAAVGCTVLLGASWFYTAIRPDAKAASVFSGTAQIAAFAAVGAPLSYIAASAGLPLWDATLAAWDRKLGFDWNAWLVAMNSHPVLHSVFALAYLSFFVQVATTVIALALSGRLLHLRIFVMSFCLATLIVIAVSAIAPAEGVWGHLNLRAQDYPNIVPVTRELHLPLFNGLRDGTMRILTAQGSEGIITFPSLHAALGLLFILALWPVPYLRWAATLLNTIMIASTPIDGGHYFVDAIAGLGIAAACWMCARRMLHSSVEVSVLPLAADAPPLAMPVPVSVIGETKTIASEPAKV